MAGGPCSHLSTLQATIEKMRSKFATHSLLITDNGTTFTSSEFEMFLKKNGIRQVANTPYHPATYGSVERAVQTETKMKKAAPNASMKPECLNSYSTVD